MIQVCAINILYRYLLYFLEIILKTLKKCKKGNINDKVIYAASGAPS